MTERNSRYWRYRRYLNQLAKLYEKEPIKTYTGLVATLLSVAFFIFFAIRPTFTTIAGLLKEIEDKRIIAEKLDKKIDSLNRAQKNYQHVADRLFLIDEALPQKAKVADLIQQIEYLGWENQLPLENLQIGEVSLKKTVKEAKTELSGSPRSINFSLDTTVSTFSAVDQLVADLNNLRRLVIVNPLAYEAKPESGQAKVRLTLKGAAFYLEPPYTKITDQK